MGKQRQIVIAIAGRGVLAIYVIVVAWCGWWVVQNCGRAYYATNFCDS